MPGNRIIRARPQNIRSNRLHPDTKVWSNRHSVRLPLHYVILLPIAAIVLPKEVR